MELMTILMDGVTYRVRVVYNTLVRAFELVEGPVHGDMLSGRHERDLVGTKYTYEMGVEPDPRYQSDYDAFFEAISDPVNSHSITVPNGQGTLTYQAMIERGSDTYRGQLAGQRRWGGLVVTFKAISVQKEPTT